MRRWPAYRTMWIFLLLGWTVSAADRALTGPVVTWMIENKVGFLADVEKPFALGGLIGGLFFAGYMLTQFPGGYLGDKYGHRTIITISLIWAGIATMVSGVITGLVAFIAVRVITGLGEGAFYSNDRSLIAQETPREKRSLGMGVVITGLAHRHHDRHRLRAEHDQFRGRASSTRRTRGGCRSCCSARSRCVVGIAVAAYFRRQEPGLPYGRATLQHARLRRPSASSRSWPSTSSATPPASRDLWIAVLEVALALSLVVVRLRPQAGRARPGPQEPRPDADQPRVHRGAVEPVVLQLLVGLDRRRRREHSSFGKSALIAAFNAGAGILGFPTGGWLSDVAVRRGIGRKPLVIAFTTVQFVLTLAFGFVVAAGAANVWVMAALLFGASTFFNAMQPIAQAMLADIADPEHHGAAFGMNNLIGEIGAVLSPAVSGALRDATGGWSAAVFVDAALIGGAILLFLFVREATGSAEEGPAGRFRRAPAAATVSSSTA